jgi:uncharacterized protein
MLIDDIKRRIRQAMKDGNTVEKEVLRVALGEIQTTEARGTESATDDTAAAVVRKLIKSNEETASLTEDGARKHVLEQEVAVLRSLLPQVLSVDAIVEALGPVRDAVRAAANDGQATGIAMKHLKSAGANVSGKDVAEAVRKLRT